MPTTKPNYVVTIPMLLQRHLDNSSSEGESDSEFTKEELANPKRTFQMVNKRGLVEASAMISPHVPNYQPLSKLITIYFNESFHGSQNPLEESLKRLTLVVGLNQRRSLSNSHNRTLENLMSKSSDNNDPKKYSPFIILGFFWKPRWQRELSKDKYKEVPFPTVQRFYRALKKRDRKAAIEFREYYENGAYRNGKTNLTVPYREIRDEIKNHPQVEHRIAQQRQEHSTMLMGFMDADTKTLIHEEQGVFTTYDKHIEDNPQAVILSTGYTVEKDENPLRWLAVEIDRLIRYSIAQSLPQCVYFPEPNFIVMLEATKNKLHQNFSEGKKHYQSPQESTLLIRHILKSRNLQPETALHFSQDTPLTTAAPDRFRKNYSAHFQENRVSNWGLFFIKECRGLSQSHYHPLKLAKIMRNGLTHHLRTLNSTEEKKLLGLLTQVFNYYDPYHISHELKKDNIHNNFLQAFTDSINRYQKHILRHEFYLTKKSTEKSSLNTVMAELQGFFNSTSQDYPGIIKQAISSAMGNLVLFFKKNLFLEPEIIYLQQLLWLLNESYHSTSEDAEIPRRLFLPRYIETVRGTVYNSWMTKLYNHYKGHVFTDAFQSETNRITGPWDTTPLHWACIFGREEYVDFLLSKGSETFTKALGQTAFNGVIPLHCFIKMIPINGLNLSFFEKITTMDSMLRKNAKGNNAIDLLFDYVYDEKTLTECLKIFYEVAYLKHHPCEDDFYLDESETTVAPHFRETLYEFFSNSFVKLKENSHTIDFKIIIKNLLRDEYYLLAEVINNGLGYENLTTTIEMRLASGQKLFLSECEITYYSQYKGMKGYDMFDEFGFPCDSSEDSSSPEESNGNQTSTDESSESETSNDEMSDSQTSSDESSASYTVSEESASEDSNSEEEYGVDEIASSRSPSSPSSDEVEEADDTGSITYTASQRFLSQDGWKRPASASVSLEYKDAKRMKIT